MQRNLSQEELKEGIEEVKATTYGKEAVISIIDDYLADKGRNLLLSRAKPQDKDELLLDHAKYNSIKELKIYFVAQLGADNDRTRD